MSVRRSWHPAARGLVLSCLALACAACAAGDRAGTADSLQELRTAADSIAAQMATDLATSGSRTGRWSEGDASSEWTARMQGGTVLVIEEILRFGETGAASRAFFFGPDGALEEFSEQRSQRVSFPDRSPATQVTVTAIDFRGAPVATRTVDGVPADVPAYEMTNVRSHAEELLVLARATPSAPDRR